jgi:predicted secreted Zn-dependent protease
MMTLTGRRDVRGALAAAAIAGMLVVGSPVLGAGQVIETIETYTVSGTTGIELYRSIGERGPKLGPGRTIAVTNFRLTWRRDYQVRDGACVLASAIPKLVITYHLPKVAGRLQEPLAKNWTRFVEGVAAHERVHGQQIRQMAADIEAQTVGLTVPDDPKCQKIKAEMTVRLKRLSDARQAASADFDRVELSEGGNVGRLVLMLVNGG